MKKIIVSLILIVSMISTADAGGIRFGVRYIVASTRPNRAGRVSVGPRIYGPSLIKPIVIFRSH